MAKLSRLAIEARNIIAEHVNEDKTQCAGYASEVSEVSQPCSDCQPDPHGEIGDSSTCDSNGELPTTDDDHSICIEKQYDDFFKGDGWCYVTDDDFNEDCPSLNR